MAKSARSAQTVENTLSKIYTTCTSYKSLVLPILSQQLYSFPIIMVGGKKPKGIPGL